MAFLYQAGLACNSAWPIRVFEVDDQDALWCSTQIQPLSLYRLTNQDFARLNIGGSPYGVGQSLGTLQLMQDGATDIPANENWQGVKSMGGGIMLAWLASSASGKFYLMRSHDRGVSWGNANNNNHAAVLNLGEPTGTGLHDGTLQFTDIQILGTRGISPVIIGGARVYLFGEYNVNAASGTTAAGGVCRIWRSDDLGITWSVLVEFNTTGGTAQVRHCHYVGQDPYSGWIYFGFGDSATSALIAWNGTAAAPPTGTFPHDFGNFPGWRGVGIGNFRRYAPAAVTNVDVFQVTDLCFTKDWIYNPADNGDSSAVNRGIWRFRRDFTDMERVFDNSARAGHSNYWILPHSSGIIYTIEILEGTSTDGILYIHASINNGDSWYEAAKFPFKASGVGSVDCFLERAMDKAIWVSTRDHNLWPAANSNSYQLFPTALRSPINTVSGG